MNPLGVLKKTIVPEQSDEIADVDAQLADVKTRLAALATAEADQHAGLDALGDEFRSAIALSHDTTEIETKILGGQEHLRKLALRRTELEKLLGEKSRVLTARRKAVRVARLQAAHASMVDDMPAADAAIVETGLAISRAVTKREKLIFSINAVADRLRRLGVPTEQRNFPLPHLDGPLVAADPAAARSVTFGTVPFRWESIEIPVVNHDLRVPVLELDDDAEEKS